MNQEKPTPIIPPMESDHSLKRYHCPFCSRFLFKGNVQNLKMVCPHCQKLIRANENQLFHARMEDDTHLPEAD